MALWRRAGLCVAVSSVGLALQAQTPAQRPATGVIAGQVVDITTGEPLADAVVTLGGQGPTTPTLTGNASRVIVDDRGRFAFTNLQAGVYSVSAGTPGYADGAFGRNRPGAAAGSISLVAGGRVTDLKIRLWKFAVISGTVRDETGDPIVAASVRVLQRRFSAGRIQLTLVEGLGLNATTDDRGAYRIAALTPGEYIVVVPSVPTTIPVQVIDEMFGGTSELGIQIRTEIFKVTSSVSTPGSPQNQRIGNSILQVQGRSITPPAPTADGRLAVYATTFFPQSLTSAGASVVGVAAGEERSGIDFNLRLVAGLTVSGSLMGPDGPVGRTALRLVPAAEDLLSNDYGFEGATSMSDGNGAFTFLGVPAGSYVLRVTKVPRPRPVPAGPQTTVQVGGGTIALPGGPPARPRIPDGPTLWTTDAVNVGDKDLTGLVVNLRPGIRMRGRLEFAGSGPPPDAAALARLPITLMPAEGRIDLVDDGQVDSDRSFATYGMPAGRYFIVMPQPSGWTLRSITWQGRDMTTAPIELKGADVDGVVIQFTDHPSVLSGTARTPQGAADVDATVVAFPTAYGDWPTFASRGRYWSRRVGEAGSFSIPGLPPGDYYVAAIPDAVAGRWGDAALLEVLSRVATRVHVNDGETTTVDLRTVQGIK